MTFDRNINVGQLMTTDVVTLGPNDTLLEVDRVFRVNSFHHIPVVDKENKVVGMVSRTDFYKMQDSFTLFNTIKAEEYNQAIFKSILVEEIMAKQLAKLNPSDSAMIAIGMFRENLFHALPIVDEDNHLLGLLSTYDLLAYAYNEPMYLEQT